jgi:hypothetical protein
MKLKVMNSLSINKKNIINFIIIVIALPIAINIYKSQVKSIELLKNKKDIELKKNEVLQNISISEKTVNSYKDILNRKDISLVLNRISDIAKKSGVKIIWLKPVAPQDYSIYIKYSFDLAVDVDNYHTLGKFISALESNPDVYFVERLTIKSTEGPGELAQAEKLTINLTLSTILLRI